MYVYLGKRRRFLFANSSQLRMSRDPGGGNPDRLNAPSLPLWPPACRYRDICIYIGVYIRWPSRSLRVKETVKKNSHGDNIIVMYIYVQLIQEPLFYTHARPMTDKCISQMGLRKCQTLALQYFYFSICCFLYFPYVSSISLCHGKDGLHVCGCVRVSVAARLSVPHLCVYVFVPGLSKRLSTVFFNNFHCLKM